MRYITVEDLEFHYDNEPVLENIHYHLDSGEFVTLTGENGAAKTTLIKATLGILKPKHGKITISEKSIRGKKLRMAYLPQQIASFNAGFPSTVYEFVKSGRYPRQGFGLGRDVGTSGQALGLSKWGTKATGCDCADVCL